MPTDLLEERRLSRSAVRHRPIASDAVNTQVRTPRASRARQHHEPHTTGGPPLVAARPRRRSKAPNIWVIYVVLGGLSAMLLLWLGQMLLGWAARVSDDLRYGYPRTTQLDRFVGHETGQTPTHFIATNVNGQIYIVEIPGGNPGASHLLVGPHLIGIGADLAPVSLSFPGDPQHPDLLVTVDGIQVKFRNTGSTYIPAS